MNCNVFERRGLTCPKSVKYAGWLLAAALIAGFAAFGPRWNPVTPVVPSGVNADAPQVLLNSLNEHRREAGLQPLTPQPALGYVATEHADDMVVRNYFNHVSPDGVSPFHLMHRANIHYVWAGENIAESDYSTAAASALWRSPEHRANILNPHYKHVGISARERPNGAVVFVEEFSN